MTAERARERFVDSRVARLATVDAEGRPHLVPVVFALTGNTLAFAVDHKPKRTTALKRLANLRTNPAVSLLVDEYDEDWDHLWWARADGTATVLPPAADAEPSARHVRLLTEKYRTQYAERPPEGPVVAVTVTRWSGWHAT
ncbi:TIGR03668 family PPOX class F420-dependent oxidoreductase [Streptomyces sp. NPDC090442]|uniref:TIGR03668 family PPOX class F420-dependent oxidoreductase n=1 Tax=Streptomyces sp. NPDC090442 TaxID=3365962 RepID=UPI00382DB9B4